MSLKYKLPPGYEIREIPGAEFWDLWTRPAKNIFKLNLGLYFKNKFVGWSWGFQEQATVYYMRNSAILPTTAVIL
ncbi:MAG: hypothetical protein NDI63_11815 [Pseudobdellovibrio sp.]|nr:hypothetical protein [Pseudobdellovibrio sp.]